MFTENALTVLKARYFLTKEDGTLETAEEMCERVAGAIASVEKQYGASPKEVKAWANQFKDLLLNCEFMPNSPCLANANARTGMLSACFVLPVGDSMEEIFDGLKWQALIHKTGGGTGFCFSTLRPKNDPVKGTQSVSSGPLSFLDIYDKSTEAIKQGGMRRGANMATFHDYHPDIFDFVDYKRDLSKLNNFNVSVLVTDDFMNAVEKDETYFYKDLAGGLIIDNGVAKGYKARELFKKMVEGAWLSGEPGCLFIDRMNESHPILGDKYDATNPCGEQALSPFDSCNLGSINLAKFVENNHVEWEGSHVDWKGLKRAVRLTVRFLDNVIDANRYVLPQIKDVTLANRRIGLGVMGWADMLVQLGISYGSETSFELAEEIQAVISDTAQMESSNLGTTKGNFPNWGVSIYGKRSTFGTKNTPMRNAATTTVAPTGTISIIADCSSGIEPLYGIAFRRFQADRHMIEVNPTFERIAKERGFYSEELVEKIINQGSVQHLDEVPEDVKRLFVVAHDLTPVQHVRMQAAFQIAMGPGGNSISKTINFGEESTVEEVEAAYMLAWKSGCKGITVYRNNSRKNQPLHNNKKSEEVQQVVAEFKDREFNGETVGRKYKIATPYGSMHVYVGSNNNGELVELIATIGKNGGIPNAEAEAISRLVSLMLRKGMEYDIIDQLRSIGSPSPVFYNGKSVTSVADGIAQVLEKHLTGKVEKLPLKNIKDHNPICPECQGTLVVQEGCFHCNCGYAKC